MTREVLLETHDDGRIAALVLNRPAKRNALSPPMLTQLRVQLASALSGHARVLLLRSAADGVFCAGFDINYIGTDEQRTGAAALYEAFTAIEDARQVSVSFADGLVVGGGTELFVSCDLRLATPRTTFRITPVKLSVVYSLEGLSRFMRIVGPTAAAELFLVARQLSAEEALRVGLVTRIVPDLGAALEYCREAARCAPQAQQAMKAMLRHLARHIVPAAATDEEWRRFAALKEAAEGSEDHREALRAFAEKRAPIFRGS